MSPWFWVYIFVLFFYTGIGVFCYMQMENAEQAEKIKIALSVFWPFTLLVFWISMVTGVIRKEDWRDRK